MKLQELLADIECAPLPLNWQRQEIVSVCSDSRKVSPGGLFVALAGPKTHGALFLREAITRGAKVLLIDPEVTDVPWSNDVLCLKVGNTRTILSQLLDKFYDFPTRKVQVVGVTGTNGKTTITYLLESVLSAHARKCGVIGTIEHRWGGCVHAAKNTTPGMEDNYQYLAEMAAQGADYCLMEVSSHALDQGRVSGIPFKGGLFTNLTGDHLDYHKTMEEYFLAKARLFTGLGKDAVAVINGDDHYGPRLAAMATTKTMTYGIDQSATVTAREIHLSFKGSEFTVTSPIGDFKVITPLVGRHNIYNILAVISFSLFAEVPVLTIQKGIADLRGVPGRLERIDVGQDFSVFVDYAHTEDALKNVLSSLRHVSPARIIVVFGCGGDRDSSKRPKMGRVASQGADYTILTNDNPRREEPDDIVRQIVSGLTNDRYQIILDRRQAITAALAMAKRDDIVLIAGKGHEDYQIFKDKTVEFREREIVRELLYTQGYPFREKT